MKVLRRPLAIASGAVLAVLLGATGSAQAAMDVPAASLTAVDVPGTTALAAEFPDQLSRYDYVEREYYVAGEGNRYRITNALSDAQLVDGGWPYKTRVLVRKPADPAKFNGTVVVEWTNVTLGQDMDFVYQAAKDYLMREGYAVASLSAQNVGVTNLKTWSPARYGSLSLTVPTTDANNVSLGTDLLSYDVLSQTVQALRAPGNIALAGLNVKRVIASGQSQSAGRLTTYYNAIDPLHRVVDGILFYDGAGVVRTDSPTKMISVSTEISNAAPAADSAATRRWEIAGASHVSLDEAISVSANMARDNAIGNTLMGLMVGCTNQPMFSTIPNWMVVDAAFESLGRWIGGGSAPSSAPRLQRGAGGVPLQVNGKAVGGLQLTQFTQPLAVFQARNAGGAFCGISGYHRYYSQAELATLYPDRMAFARDVLDTTSYNLAQGFILEPEAKLTRAEAFAAVVPGVDAGAPVGGSVAPALALTIGAPASFGPFTPGLAKDYTTSTTANVISTAGDAALTVADPSSTATGRLVNGAFSLPQALQANAGGPFAAVGGSSAPTLLKSWTAPVSNEPVTIMLKQSIGATDALRTGAYSKTLTFTLSTTTP